VASLAIYVFNAKYNINRVGYPPVIELPVTVQVMGSYFVSWGMFLSVLTVTYWLIKSRVLPEIAIVYVGLFMGFMASVTMGSRVQFILYVLAVIFVIIKDIPALLNWRKLIFAGVLTCVAMAGSLAIVSFERAYQFLEPMSSPALQENSSQTASLPP